MEVPKSLVNVRKMNQEKLLPPLPDPQSHCEYHWKDRGNLESKKNSTASSVDLATVF